MASRRYSLVYASLGGPVHRSVGLCFTTETRQLHWRGQLAEQESNKRSHSARRQATKTRTERGGKHRRVAKPTANADLDKMAPHSKEQGTQPSLWPLEVTVIPQR